MKRIVVLALIAAAGIGGYQYYRHRRAAQPLEWSGTIEARTIDVGSKMGGRIKNVLVREGDHVAVDQPLIELETGDLEAQRLQAEGQLIQAEAALERVASAHGVSSTSRQEIAAAEAELRAQSAGMAKAKLDQERVQQLVKTSVAPQADLDNANATLESASAQRAAAQARLGQLMRQTSQDVKAAEGQRKLAQGKLDQVDEWIRELTIRAPLASRVESLDLRPGDIIAANATAARLLEPDQPYVRIYVPETQLGHIRQGMTLPVYVDSFPKRSFPGVVEFISTEGEFTPRNLQTSDQRANQVFAAHVRLKNDGDALRAGMAAIVRVEQ